MTEVREFQFDVMIRLPRGCPDIEDLLDRLYESGCDDAIVGCGNLGSLGLSFIREGTDREVVIAGAVQDALAGLPEGAVVERVELRVTKKVRERDFFLALMKKREAEKKTGVTSVYLPEEIDTGFLSRDHGGTVSIWSDKKSQTVTFNETSLEELLWRHRFLDRRIVDEKTQCANFVWKYKAWHGLSSGKPCRMMQVSVHRVLEHGFSSRVFRCILKEGKCSKISNCAPGCRARYWDF